MRMDRAAHGQESAVINAVGPRAQVLPDPGVGGLLALPAPHPPCSSASGRSSTHSRTTPG